MIINNNNDKRAKFLNSAGRVTGFFNTRFTSVWEYLNLKEVNKQLALQNHYLSKLYWENYQKGNFYTESVNDTVFRQKYTIIGARVINNSVYKTHNYLTLDKGKRHGIKVDMAVVGHNGTVGIVRAVSENFSSVISVLNTKLGISAKMKRNEYFGSVTWDGVDYKEANLSDIPNHVKIAVGDTVLTSGYSSIFPEGIIVGTVKQFEPEEGSNFFKIRINLSTDYKNLVYVNVIGNLLRNEQLELEKGTEEK